MPTDNIEEIKSKIDVVDLIQEYIQVKPAGTNSFKALCPFHNEKTPSFVISRDKQIWHCFGCGEGGDIFEFIQKMEGLEFPEALRTLAKKAGVQLQYQDPALSNQKTRVLDVCKAAADFYHRLLLEHPKAQFVRDYLAKRKVSAETIDAWQLGFAPDAWDVLNTYLVQRKFSADDIFQAGLTLKKDRGVGYNDRFRNRLIFPIADTHGNVIGFGGRWLGEEKDIAKYINTPQTIVYNKSAVLYGIDKAKVAIKKEKLAIIVEGYMDCIASHQAGVTNVVASSGTALTHDQVRLLKRFTGDLAFAFDQDTAGDAASKRGIDVAWEYEMGTKVILLPPGAKDPDELVKKHGAGAWRKAIEGARSIMDYYFDTTFRNADLSNVEHKKRATKALLPVIAKLGDTIEQTHYLQKLGSLLHVGEDVLRDKLKTIRSKHTPGAKAVPAATPPVRDRHESIGDDLLGVVLQYPGHLNYCIEHIEPEHFPTVKLQQLYKLAIVYYTKNHLFDYTDFIRAIPAENKNLATFAEVLAMHAEHAYGSFDDDSLRQVVVQNARELRRSAIQRKLREVEVALRDAETNKDERNIQQCAQHFSELTAELKQLE